MGRVIDLKNTESTEEEEEQLEEIQDSQDSASKETKQPEQPDPGLSVLPKEDIAIGPGRPVFDFQNIEWSGPLYYKHSDGSLAPKVAVALVALAVLSLFIAGVTTAILIVLIAMMIVINSRRTPPVTDFVITETEVIMGEKTFEFKNITSFWIDHYEELGVSELSLQINKWYAPYIKVPLQQQDPVQVRDILLEFIPETEHPDSVVEIISKLLGL